MVTLKKKKFIEQIQKDTYFYLQEAWDFLQVTLRISIYHYQCSFSLVFCKPGQSSDSSLRVTRLYNSGLSLLNWHLRVIPKHILKLLHVILMNCEFTWNETYLKLQDYIPITVLQNLGRSYDPQL